MKAIDVLKNAQKICDTYYVVVEPTTKKYGLAVRLCDDPEIEMVHIEECSSKTQANFSVGKKHYIEMNSFCINADCFEKFVEVAKKVINTEYK